MVSVRGKFKVDKLERIMASRPARDADGALRKDASGFVISEPCELHSIILSPVYSADPESENGRFWSATPSGEIRLSVVREETGRAFELGREYYVDFTPC